MCDIFEWSDKFRIGNTLSAKKTSLEYVLKFTHVSIKQLDVFVYHSSHAYDADLNFTTDAIIMSEYSEEDRF